MIQNIQFAEDRLIARFWALAHRKEQAEACIAAIGMLSEDHFSAPGRGVAWRALAARFAADREMAVHDAETRRELAAAVGEALADELWSLADAEAAVAAGIEPLNRTAKPVYQAARGREAVRALRQFSTEAGNRLEKGIDATALREWFGDQLVQLTDLHSRRGGDGTLTRRERLERERRALQGGAPQGVPWPWAKFQRNVGSAIRPGYFVGLTGLAGSGKSTLLANIFMSLVGQGVPVIALITEDCDEWLRRAIAAAARIPQSVAETQAWDADEKRVLFDLMTDWRCDADEVRRRLNEYRPQFEKVLNDLESSSTWEILDRSMTPEEFIARARAVRMRWRGRQVVLLVDHLHNLKFPEDNADRHIGPACQKLKEFITSDDEGGMSLIGLFQPRKPARNDNDAAYRAITAQDIAGRVAPHLNLHVSVFRQLVETHARDLTPWGTPATLMRGGLPAIAKSQTPGDAGTKDDDQHIFLLADKRRRAGLEDRKRFFLNMEAPSGRIYELDSGWGS